MSARVAAAAGVATVPVAAPVVWDFFGYPFQAGPLIVAICAVLLTRVIVTLNANPHKPRRGLDVTVTGLSALVTAIWVQAHQLPLLQAGISGITAGALGVSIIGLAKAQGLAKLRAVLRAIGGALQDTPADMKRQLDSIPDDPPAKP